MKAKPEKKKGSFVKQLKRDRSLWLFCLPGVVLTFIFSYIPMYGVQLAFRRYNAKAGILGSKWVGLYYFQRFFESPYFGRFIDCLVDAVDISKRLTAFNDALSQELINRYGEKIVTQATIYCSFSDAVPASITSDPHFHEVVKEIEAAIDKGRNQEYAQKVARYELREAFEDLIRGIE